MASARSTSRSEARIVGVRSLITSRSMACGIDARSRGRISRTRPTVSITLAPGSFRMNSRMAGLPLATP